MLDKKIIEKSLALCGREYSDMKIEDYCYFLLSPEFIEKYMPLLFPFEITSDYEGYLRHTAKDFGEAIYEYQSGNEDPLIELLSKIGNS